MSPSVEAVQGPRSNENRDSRGALDFSTLSSPDRHDGQHLVRKLIEIYSRMIENANFISRLRDSWILRLGTVGPLVEINAGLMLAIDRDGRILGANTDARRELRRLESTPVAVDGSRLLVGNHLAAVFGSGLDDV